MTDFFQAVTEFMNGTNIPEQIRNVDVRGLFTNTHFILPFILLVGWMIYKQAVNNLVILALVIGLWIFSGSSFMQDIFVNGELQLRKVLPVAGVGVFAIAVAVYFIFIRD